MGSLLSQYYLPHARPPPFVLVGSGGVGTGDMGSLILGCRPPRAAARSQSSYIRSSTLVAQYNHFIKMKKEAAVAKERKQKKYAVLTDDIPAAGVINLIYICNSHRSMLLTDERNTAYVHMRAFGMHNLNS